MYVNSYVLSVPEDRKDDYTRIVIIFAEVAKDFGALEIFENWEFEIPDGDQTDYRKAVKAEPGEKIVLSWVIWPDRETGAKAHKGMYADPRMDKLGEMPFDGKRMILGGFEPIFSYRKD
jgi:uncharacterized protein YbaA (DUF1428 family)